MAWEPNFPTRFPRTAPSHSEGVHELTVAREILDLAKLCTYELFGDATPTRTAEVTICRIPRRTAPSPSTATELFEAGSVEAATVTTAWAASEILAEIVARRRKIASSEVYQGNAHSSMCRCVYAGEDRLTGRSTYNTAHFHLARELVTTWDTSNDGEDGHGHMWSRKLLGKDSSTNFPTKRSEDYTNRSFRHQSRNARPEHMLCHNIQNQNAWPHLGDRSQPSDTPRKTCSTSRTKQEKSTRLTKLMLKTLVRLRCAMRHRPRSWQSLQRDCPSDIMLVERTPIQRDPLSHRAFTWSFPMDEYDRTRRW